MVMLKVPRPGRVKTRLARDMGVVPAAWWFRRTSLALIHRLRDPRWRLVLAVAPDREGMESRCWPADLERSAQGRGDLGQRMAHQLRRHRPGPVCVIGADVPGITRQAVARAFQALKRADAVFGPATDGGYWLVGLTARRGVPPTLFRAVRWSTEHALGDTIATLRGARIEQVDELRDVDTIRDLESLRIR